MASTRSGAQRLKYTSGLSSPATLKPHHAFPSFCSGPGKDVANPATRVALDGWQAQHEHVSGTTSSAIRSLIQSTGSPPSLQAQSKAGKSVFNPVTRAALGCWRPKYESFEAFMAAGAKDFYTASGLF